MQICRSRVETEAPFYYGIIWDWTTRVSLPNGILFRPTALAWGASVTDDTRTDIQTVHAR